MPEMISRYMQTLIRRIWDTLFSKDPNPLETIELLIYMLLGMLLSVLVATFFSWLGGAMPIPMPVFML